MCDCVCLLKRGRDLKPSQSLGITGVGQSRSVGKASARLLGQIRSTGTGQIRSKNEDRECVQLK